MNSGPVLEVGAAGPDVRRLQRLLVMIKDLDFTGIDGLFGPKTDHAVRSCQQAHGLAVDGIVGPLTWQALPADPDTPELAEGSNGPVVSSLQQALARAGGPLDPGPVDGIFGDRTEAAVRQYQTDRALAVDGIVGDRTWWAPAGAAGATLASLSGLTTV
jgi:peptidoglycan hydrolase-like protein with peptidoglycan-binding domain